MNSKRPIKSIVLTSIAIIVIMLFVTVSFAADTAKVSVETARLRKEASEDSTILELISLGEEVEVLGQSGNWYQVKYKGITGYLRNDLIQVDRKTQSNGSETATSGETVDTSATTQNNTQTGNEAGTTSEDNTQANSNQENTNNETNTENAESTQTQNTSETQQTENTSNSQDTTANTENEEDLTGTYQFFFFLEIKITPLINSLAVANVKNGDKIEIQDKVNEWVLVSNENIQGWARFNILSKVEKTDQNQVLTTENITQTTPENEEQPEEQKPQTKTMYVNSQTVNVRSSADQSSSVVTQLSINTQVTVISEQNGWSEVTFNGGKGYIASNLLSTTTSQTSRGSSTPRTGTTTTSQTNAQDTSSSTSTNTSSSATSDTSSNVATSSKGADVLAYAMKFVGYPYVYGGSSTSGFDCSGFTQYVYKHFGVTLNRTASAQSANGTAVSRSNLQPGDLVMFGSPINHVGIYAGGGRIVHAANPSRGVTTDTINSGYYNINYVCARRIF